MGFVSEDDVRNRLGPYESDISDIVLTAWQRWMALSEQDRKDLTRHEGRRANAINAFMIGEAARLFAGTEVRPIDSAGTTTFLLGEFLLRFKKLDADGQSRNYPTQRALNWNSQLRLPGIPGVGRLDIGYVLNELETAVSQVLIAHRSGDRVAWAYSIWDAVAQALPDGFISAAGTPESAPKPALRYKRRAAGEEPDRKSASDD